MSGFTVGKSPSLRGFDAAEPQRVAPESRTLGSVNVVIEWMELEDGRAMVTVDLGSGETLANLKFHIPDYVDGAAREHVPEMCALSVAKSYLLDGRYGLRVGAVTKLSSHDKTGGVEGYLPHVKYEYRMELVGHCMGFGFDLGVNGVYTVKGIPW